MSRLTVDAAELQQLAGRNTQAADAAGKGAEATESVDLIAKLYETHGVISGPSNSAVGDKVQTRQDAARAIQHACQALAEALQTAQKSYTKTDQDTAQTLGNPS
ncbi:type VII secretion target [Mycobacterium sp. 050134]|uniref:type VII secretion target n=1 Tax=Mycobacterium sp. 050134 TaxID=3096111 RepID=UPI002ED98B82